MNKQLVNLRESVQTAIDRNRLLRSDWIIRNFKHPKKVKESWSFKDHEYQIDIIDDPAQDMVVKKCAQVGVSELEIRDTLAFCAMHDYVKVAYVLPTSKFSNEFSATRFVPAIESSETISEMMSKDVDNTGVKRIGTCFLMMRGTSGTVAAISVDLDMLVIDEIDFCNQEVIGSFSSRLQHSLLKITKNFSTPTVPDYGVSALFNESSRAIRMVKCGCCGEWVAPDFFRDVIIPGFDKKIEDFRKDDAYHPGIKQSYLSCPSCHNELTVDVLNDPERREWIHEFPGILRRGYHVRPWDVPTFNPIPDVLFGVTRYKLHSDWVNFRVGSDYTSAENSFLIERLEKNTLESTGWSIDNLSTAGVKGIFVGADLGKLAHVLVGVATDMGLTVVAAEVVDVREISENNLGKYLVKLFRGCAGSRIIVDAAPNYETALYLHNTLYEKQAYGAYYGGESKSSLDIYQFNEIKGIVTIDRTASLDDTCKAFNAGTVKWSQMGSLPVVKEHLKSLKKVKKLTSAGATEVWDKTGPDHFGHALNYLYAAYASVEDRFVYKGVGLLPRVSGIVLKQSLSEN